MKIKSKIQFFGRLLTIVSVAVLSGAAVVTAAPDVSLQVNQGTDTPKAADVEQALDKFGISNAKVSFVVRKREGRVPQITRDVFVFNAKIKNENAEWFVAVEQNPVRIVRLWGSVAFVSGGKPVKVEDYSQVVKIADLWFERLNINLQQFRLFKITRPKMENGRWLIVRLKALSDDVFVREAVYMEIDGASGGLLSVGVDPTLPTNINKPANRLPIDKISESVLTKIANSPTEYFQPTKTSKLIKAVQLLSWIDLPSLSNDKALTREEIIKNRTSETARTVEVRVQTRWLWRLFIVGRPTSISRLPPEFQVLKPAQPTPVLYDVMVDMLTNDIDIHEAKQQDELWLLGQVFRW